MDIFKILNLVSALFALFWLFVFPFLLPQIMRNYKLLIAYSLIILLPLLLLYFKQLNEPLCNFIPTSESDESEIIGSSLCKSSLLLLKPIIIATIAGTFSKSIIFYLDYRNNRPNRKLITFGAFICSLAIALQ